VVRDTKKVEKHCFTQRRQTATKSLPTFKLDITVSYVGYALQTWHVITLNKCVQLLTK